MAVKMKMSCYTLHLSPSPLEMQYHCLFMILFLFKVYKGPLLSYTASLLPAGSGVEARVRAVRQATVAKGDLFSPFTDVKHRTLPPTMLTADNEDDEAPDESTTETKPRITLTDKQKAFILFVMSVVLTLLAALGIGYWTM